MIHEKKITVNESKSIYSQLSVKHCSYYISHGEIRPDPDRLKPLRDLPVPQNVKRIIGLFSYYSKWSPNISEKLKPLSSVSSFPLTV